MRACAIFVLHLALIKHSRFSKNKKKISHLRSLNVSGKLAPGGIRGLRVRVLGRGVRML